MIFGNKSKRERQYQGALRAALERVRVRVEEPLQKPAPHAFGQIAEVHFILGMFRQAGGPFDDPAVVVEVGGADERSRRRAGILAVAANRR